MNTTTRAQRINARQDKIWERFLSAQREKEVGAAVAERLRKGGADMSKIEILVNGK
jgi:hypothetical protein